MPKLSRRRRQLKDILSNAKKEFLEEDEEAVEVSCQQSVSEDNSDEKSHDQKPIKKKANRGNKSEAVEELNDEKESDERPWVQCNACDKWRALPVGVDTEALPDTWTCSMNIWNSTLNTCIAPEESYEEAVDEEIKSFLRVWTKKLKNADRSESKLPPSAVTRGRKRKVDIDWVQCKNPACRKWRTISIRGLDYSSMFSKLNTKGSWRTRDTTFFCSMNFWDETKASCSSPQESLIDAPWNLQNVIISSSSSSAAAATSSYSKGSNTAKS